MTFWQLVLTPRGYALTPYVTIYNNMVEIQLHGSAATGGRKVYVITAAGASDTVTFS